MIILPNAVKFNTPDVIVERLWVFLLEILGGVFEHLLTACV